MLDTLLIRLIEIYQRSFSLLLGSNCRFYPPCSHYAKEAIQKHGALKGSWLSLTRLSKCHPWHEGGIDPVPEAKSQTPAPGEI